MSALVEAVDPVAVLGRVSNRQLTANAAEVGARMERVIRRVAA